MKDKILVEILVPAAGEKFDVYIPLEGMISEIIVLVAKVLSDLSEGKYKADEAAALCDMKTGDILDINMRAAELNLKNGSYLMLI